MPNRFELLVPDIVGSFERGRAQSRQNRVRQLAGDAYGAAPENRQGILAQIARDDPNAAMGLEQTFGNREDQQQKRYLDRMEVTAGALVNAPEQMRPALYQSMLKELRTFVPNAPEQFTPEMIPIAQQFLAGRRGGTPAQAQHFNAMSQGMKPEDIERARRIELGLEGRAASGGFGFRTVTLPDGRETLVVTDPRTGGVRQATPQEVQAFMGGAPSAQGGAPTPSAGGAFVGPTPGQKAADIEQGKADVQLRTAPQIASATTLAEQQAKNQAERQKVQQQNQTAFNVYTQARNNLQSAMAGTATGPLAGRLPAVTAAAQIAEGAGATMAPVLKNLFRDAGDGTFTEGDQKLLTDMLPKRTDHPEVVTAKLEMMDRIIDAKLGGGAPSQASRPPAQSGSPVRVSTPAEAMQLPSGSQFVTPDGRVKVRP